MSQKQINQLPAGIANVNAVVAADNADLSTTEKIKLGDIANLPHSHDDRYYTKVEADSLIFSPWSQLGDDIAGEVAGIQTGNSVKLSGDGKVLVVGAPTDGVVNTSEAGIVRVYDWNGLAWVQRGADITGSYLGVGVAANYAGNTVAVSGVTSTGDGYVRVYSWSGSAWVQTGQEIVDEGVGDQGTAIDLDDAGTILAVGGKYNSEIAPVAGHVRVFSLNSGGTWTQLGVDIDGAATMDLFGMSVSLNSDGTSVSIGAVSPISFGGSGAGYASVYTWSGTAWTKKGSDILGEADDDHSGVSVSISNDGNTVAVGAHWNDAAGSDAGHVRVHSWNGSAWVQKGSDIDGDMADGWAGYAVSLSGDGNIVAIGSPGLAAPSDPWVATYLFSGGEWYLRGQKISGSTASGLGFSVSLGDDGSILAIGAPFASTSVSGGGLLRVYTAVKNNEFDALRDSQNINYDNATSGLAATNVKAAIDTLAGDKVTNAGNVASIRSLTQEQYDAIETPDPNTLYIIEG